MFLQEAAQLAQLLRLLLEDVREVVRTGLPVRATLGLHCLFDSLTQLQEFVSLVLVLHSHLVQLGLQKQVFPCEVGLTHFGQGLLRRA